MTQSSAGAGDHTVSVVVCAFTEERWGDLTDALAALQGQSRRPDEVVLVIDHNDVLRLRSEQAWGSRVTVVANDRGQGLSGARNTGVEAASGSIIAFLDDDAVPEPDWLERLVAPFAEPNVVGVGGAALPRWSSERPRWWPHEFDWIVGCSYRGLPEHGGDVRNVIGAAMAFRAEVFAEGERFSAAVGRVGTAPTGCEETELCIRVRRRHPEARIVFEPAARVLHRVTPARERVSYFARRCLAEGHSKAAVSELVGARDGLSSERTYVTRTLPSGVARGVGAAVHDRDTAGLARAGMIALGLTVTAAGYAHGRYGQWRRRRPASAAEDLPMVDADGPARPFRPVRLVELELTDPRPVAPQVDPATGRTYERGRVLVRQGGRPVGALDTDLVAGGLGTRELTAIGARFPATAAPGETSPDETAAGAAMPGGLAASVVIATHDRPEALCRCLDSVLATGYPDLDVVVVDNAPSSSATYDVVTRRYPQVRYVRDDVPGLARAHNTGLRLVHNPVVAFTDDDVVVDRGWVRALVAQFAAADDVGCVTGLIWPAELETVAQAMIEEHSGFGKGFERRRFNLNGSRPADPLFPYTAGSLGSGANMAFRTSVLREIGGFDPALGAGSRGRGGDDLAAFVDVILAGYALVYEPAAIVHHHHRRELEAVRAQTLNYGAGLSAYLTRLAVRRPSVLVDFVRLGPRAVRHLLTRAEAARSGQDVDGVEDSSARRRELLRLRLIGVAQGPLAYARGAHDARRAEVTAR